MKQTYKLIYLLVVAQFLLPIAFAQIYSSVNITAGPGSSPKQICIKSRELIVDGINVFGNRTGQYAFTGEQIKFNITVRDPNGWINIGSVKIFGPNSTGAVCTQMTNIPNCDGLGNFVGTTDRSYQCVLTVQPQWGLDSTVKISVLDVANNVFVNSTHEETLDFNPAISMQVTTSDNQPISFRTVNPGEWVESSNYVKIKNTAEGGVNLWVWIAGNSTGLFGSTNASICPTTNVLDWHRDVDPLGNTVVADNDPDTGVAYRAVSGTLQTPWLWMRTYNQDAGCSITNCFDGMPLPSDIVGRNVLTNNGEANVYFKIHYPVPCSGTFNQGSMLIIAKAV